MWVAMPLADKDREPVAMALAAVEQRMLPAAPRRIIEMIFDMSIPHKKDHSPEEWESIAHDFVEDLREFSEAQIADAIREYRREKPWFPKTADLVAICQNKAAHDRLICRRARVLLGLEPPMSWEVPEQGRDELTALTDARRQEIAAMVKPGPLAVPLLRLVRGDAE